ncbi:PAS domain S-box protein [Limnobacter sp.]|uniref:PAS domain S-box protein n=1 Tax=Limnobacter sp. TaxID=2003368 RepID=UPI00311FAD78
MTTSKIRYQWILAGAMLCVLGLALLAMAAADLRRINDSAEQNTQTQLRLLHDILHDEFSAIVRSFDEATLQLSDNIEVNNSVNIHKRLELLKSALPAMETIVARDSVGNILGQTGVDRDLINTNAAFAPNARLLHNERLVSFSKSFNSNQQLVLLINYQVKDPQGEMLGVIQGRLNARYLERKVASLQLGEHMRSGIAFKDGTVLLVQPEFKKIVGKQLPYFESLRTLADQTQAASNLIEHGLFKDHYFASLSLANSDQLNTPIPLYLITWADAAPMKAQWREQTISLFLGYLAFCILAVLMVKASMTYQVQQVLAKEKAKADQQFNDERFQLATESAGIGVWEYNIQDKFIRWDSAMRKIYGVKDEQELVSYKEWLSYVLPEDVNKLGTVLLEASKNQDTFQFNFNIRRASDGRIRHIQARAKTHRNAKGIPFRMIGVNVDVTVQRQFEDALREAEARFRSSFEWAAIGMAMLDFKGQFLQVNKALSEILGYSEEELLGFSFDAITHPQDTMQHTHLVRDVLKGRRHNYQLEKRYIHKEGHVVWVHLSVSAVRNDKGRVIYFISQIQDISERKRNEATLIEREHFLRTLSECLPGLVSYWSTDLRCHFANRNHEKWSSIPADKMRGQHMRKVLGEELFIHDHHYVLGVLKGEKQRFERRKPLPSGGYADMLVHLIPDVLYGKVEGFFSISTNITDFKAQQRELERINHVLTERTQQAEAASKAKGAFLANMSHEIRTPMNAIMGLLQLLEDTDLQAKQRDYLSKIGSAADVLLNVLNDILDISRVEANKLELSHNRFLLDQVLSKATDLFAYRAEEKAIQLYCTKDANCPVSLKGDRLRLAQILNNLLSNALKFTEKGRIHLQVQSVADGKQLQFSVKDSGIGMNKEQCEALFKPFSQVDDSSSRRYGGAGLGLSICKNLVELMGGRIWVESTPGVGTTFHFTVNCVEPEFKIRAEDQQALKLQTLAAPADTGPAVPPMLNKRVLVVDDHKLNRMVASEMLKKWGAQVHLAENGKEAVQACVSERYDMVLMDLQMPEMDGYEATARILEELGNAAPPIVAVTASASEQDRMDILNAGMCEHVIKPFKKETLIRILLDIQGQQSTKSL